MQTVKEKLEEMLPQLADDCTWDDVMDQIILRQKIEEGLADIAAGRVKTHEEVFARYGDLD